MIHTYKYITTKVKLTEEKLFLKKIYKKKKFFFQKKYGNSISFWDLSIFYKSAYVKDKFQFKHENFLHNRDISLNPFFGNKHLILKIKEDSKINLDIAYQGLDIFYKIFFWKNSPYCYKHTRNLACIFSKDNIKLKSQTHFLLDNLNTQFSIESFNKQIRIFHKLYGYVPYNNMLLYNYIVDEISLDGILVSTGM